MLLTGRGYQLNNANERKDFIMGWIKPNELIEVEVDGKTVSFYPLKRKDRMEVKFFESDIEPQEQQDLVYDFVEKHIVSIDGVVKADLIDFIESQSADIVARLFSEIMMFGTLTKESAENLDLPLESQQQDIPTADAKDTESGDALTKVELSKQKEKVKLN